MDMQQAYASADLGRLEERLAEAQREIDRLRSLLREWLMAHGYDRVDLRDEVAERTRQVLKT